MEERINPASALCTTYMWDSMCNRYSMVMWIDHTQRDRSYSTGMWIDTQWPMIWTVPTLVQFLPKYHMISMEERFAQASALCIAYMWDSMCNRYSTNGRSILKDRWYEQFRRPCISCPHTIQIQWRREMKGHRHSAQHTCASTCGSIILNERRFDTQGPMKWRVPTLD
jgi:hypothetical protein